jgi:hypothetical protein
MNHEPRLSAYILAFYQTIREDRTPNVFSSDN